MLNNVQNLRIFKTSTIIQTHVQWCAVRVMGIIAYLLPIVYCQISDHLLYLGLAS